MADYSLETYNDKRDFDETPEPVGKSEGSDGRALRFVVQKHAARRLHYDLRLEVDGVLKSWVVPKGPSPDPADKRLAVRTEDHPLSYAEFEGVIPEKQYGAGSMIIWDEGRFVPEEADAAAAIEDGKLSFRLDGERLKGSWTLARMNGRKKGDKENWLLIKQQDGAADDGGQLVERYVTSVRSGKKVDEVAAAGDAPEARPSSGKDKAASGKKRLAKSRGNARRRADATSGGAMASLQKNYAGVQLASLVDKPPRGEGWLHEIKYDGYRILVFVADGDVVVQTRNGHDWTHKFEPLAAALEGLDVDSAVLDGEAVLLDEAGRSDFKALQNGLGRSGKSAVDPEAVIHGYFFDLLHLNGDNIARLSLSKRRERLVELLSGIDDERVHMSESFDDDPAHIIAAACELGLEGIVSKKAAASYQPGRGRSWVKSKCTKRQEFVIAGFNPARDRSRAIGSLHLAYHKGGELVYAGKVGTGFDHKTSEALYDQLAPLARKTAPFSPAPKGAAFKDAVWVKPEVICEVRFASWTGGGKVRHASFIALRDDKPAEDIERDEEMAAAKQTKGGSSAGGSSAGGDFAVCGVSISNAGRVIFPQAGVTKGELAAFYGEMSDYIMPQIKDRMISVVRCPGGISKKCFFQRSKGKGMPAHIHETKIKHKSKTSDYMYVSRAEGLIELVQMGGVELHPWGSLRDRPARADRIIFDLDPAEDVPFEAVRLAAQDVRQRLQELGLESFVKCTGGKGLHVTVPVTRRHDWPVVKAFARGVAEQMARDLPDVYTTNMSKSKRGGKIFVDYLRNDHAATTVMDYCVRSRPGAPVAVPLAWDELDELQSADAFRLADVLKRKKKAGALMEKIGAVRQSLTKPMIATIGGG